LLAFVQVLPVFFERGAEGGLQSALEEVCDQAEDLARKGVGCIVLSDREDAMEARARLRTRLLPRQRQPAELVLLLASNCCM
jgi:Glutamate synthase central domain